MANKKRVALIYEKDGRLCVNLKCDPVKMDFWRGLFCDVVPAYHMNKTHRNTVRMDGDVPDMELFSMVENNFNLTKPKMRWNGDRR